MGRFFGQYLGTRLDIPVEDVRLQGDLVIPTEKTPGLVLFVHGSGSSRFSSRNRAVAQVLQEFNLATLLFDLLTEEEEAADQMTAEYRFDIPMLASRVVSVTQWLHDNPPLKGLKLGYFGASTGAAAALIAASYHPEWVSAIVSRGGRPDLALPVLPKMKTPTLLIVGGEDYPVIRMNQDAYARLPCEKELVIIPGATHLFEEPGALEAVARISGNWFSRHLTTEGESSLHKETD